MHSEERRNELKIQGLIKEWEQDPDIQVDEIIYLFLEDSRKNQERIDAKMQEYREEIQRIHKLPLPQDWEGIFHLEEGMGGIWHWVKDPEPRRRH
jgi:hypothetical protein